MVGGCGVGVAAGLLVGIHGALFLGRNGKLLVESLRRSEHNLAFALGVKYVLNLVLFSKVDRLEI